MSSDLSHLDGAGDPRMVDVGGKPLTRRVATATGLVRASSALIDAIREDRVAKGSVLQVARLAGIQAAKRTDSLIPLCHSLPIDAVYVELDLKEDGIAIRSEVSTTWKTGVEMEALTAASVAALTVIDMGKAIDPAMTIERIQLDTKTGGKRGDWTRDEHRSGKPK
ncbi:MAG: cyclic pyranopterin monophosphate synthase MoaC [Planctomycetota bacterium]